MSATTLKRKTRRSTKKAGQQVRLVKFRWEGRDYVLDVARNRVYHNWVALETNKGVAVLGAYKAQAESA